MQLIQDTFIQQTLVQGEVIEIANECANTLV